MTRRRESREHPAVVVVAEKTMGTDILRRNYKEKCPISCLPKKKSMRKGRVGQKARGSLARLGS
ncbi:hypothetical protein EJB05_47557 [Eragrostis curvula]|uniref:Uncharacterized protein n=1 Tax=Eragrostis curvula TaxID=38414 RepID=A0A5J9T860_9POAL|nr:hypothetical protein EJB05_47557 [Eragrostis curvula]